MNLISQTNLKLYHAGGFETERCSVRNSDFGFRRKAQVRTYLHISFIRPYRCKGDTTRGKRKLKQGQKTAFPVPLVGTYCRFGTYSPWWFLRAFAKGKHSLFLTPLFPSVFYPPTFCFTPCPNPVHLFALTYIATFTGFASPRSFICCSFFIWEQFYKCVLLPPCISFVDWLAVFINIDLKIYYIKYKITGHEKIPVDFVPQAGENLKKGLDKTISICYDKNASLWGLFFCAYFWRTPMDGHSVREGGSGKNLSFLNSINRRCRYESKGNIGLHRVQTAQLQHKEKQEERSRQTWDEQVLQVLQEAYSSQRN